MLIVWDFVNSCKTNGNSSGSRRGSAAGSLVAFSLKLQILTHSLWFLFERFLNPERISMPDIDMDFAKQDVGKLLIMLFNNMVEPTLLKLLPLVNS